MSVFLHRIGLYIGKVENLVMVRTVLNLAFTFPNLWQIASSVACCHIICLQESVC